MNHRHGHPSEDDLLLHYYGEDPDPERTRVHLEGCARCRDELSSLRELLDAMLEPAPPERGEDYGERVWQRVRPRLHARRSMRIWPAWALVAAAAVLAATFLLGRFSARVPIHPERPPERIRERVLLVALGDHLQQSQVLLLEIANGGRLEASSLDREQAEVLLAESRLYRQTAVSVGDVATADVLEELEKLLLDVAHGPGSDEAVEALRSRIEERDMLFKLRVLQTSVSEKAPRRF